MENLRAYEAMLWQRH